MSRRSEFFGPFESTEDAGPFHRLPSPNGEIYIGASRTTFEFGVPGFQRISFIRTWQSSGVRQTTLHLEREGISLDVTRFEGCGCNYPDRYEATFTTKEYTADIRFCPMDSHRRISGVYSIELR